MPSEIRTTVVLYSVRPEPYSVIHMDSALIVVAKSSGIPAQPDPTGDTALSTMLEERYGAPLHVVHRIDRPASGLVIYARTADAAAVLSAAFQRGEIQRTYWAIVASPPPEKEGTLQHRLMTRPGSNKSYVTASGGKAAELKYRVVSASDRYWLLEVHLHTGRHHQIRAQLAAVGSPIRGDLKYGAKRSIRGGGIGLHAFRVTLADPRNGERVTYVAPPPKDPLWNALTEGLRS